MIERNHEINERNTAIAAKKNKISKGRKSDRAGAEKRKGRNRLAGVKLSYIN